MRLDHRPLMRVAVVLVVDMGVLMLQRLVGVEVRVARFDQDGHPHRHQRRGSSLQKARPVAEQRHRQRGPGERRDPEQRRLPRRSQRPLRAQVEQEAGPVAHRPQRQGARHRPRRAHPLAGSEPDRQIERAGEHGLDPQELYRIFQRKPRVEVVVDRPAEAGERDGCCAGDRSRDLAPCADQRAAQHYQRARRNLTARKVLAKEQHRHRHGERRLEVEEQRAGQPADPRQPPEHQWRAEARTAQDRGSEDGHVLPPQRRLGPRAAHQHEGRRGTQVEEARQQQRAGPAQQQLGDRRSEPEEEPGKQARHRTAQPRVSRAQAPDPGRRSDPAGPPARSRGEPGRRRSRSLPAPAW